MMFSRKTLKTIPYLSFLLLFGLSACGGGGGGGGSSSSASSSGSSGSSHPSLRLSTQQLNFSSELGTDNPAAQTLYGYIDNSQSLTDTIYAFVLVNPNSIFDASIVMEPNRGVIEVSVASADSVGTGVHSDSFQVLTCYDATCNRQFENSPRTVNITYTVNKAQIATGVSSANLAGAQGQYPTYKNISVTTSSFQLDAVHPRDAFTASVQYNESETAWLAALLHKDINNNLMLDLDIVKNIPVGEYSATVRINGNSERIVDTELQISYSVSRAEFTVDKTALDFSISTGDSSSAGRDTVTVSDTREHIELTATADVDWLDLDVIDASQVNVSINENAKSLNNGTHSAMVMVEDSSGGSRSYHIPVALSVDLVRFNSFSPYFAFKDQNATVTVSGENFERLNGAPLNIFGNEISDYQVVSDSKISIEVTPAAIGSSGLDSGNNFEALFSVARLHVIEPEVYLDASISDPGASFYHKVLYEPVSQHLIVSGYEGGSLVIFVYQYIKGEWARKAIQGANNLQLSLPRISVDGNKVFCLGSTEHETYLYQMDLNAMILEKASPMPVTDDAQDMLVLSSTEVLLVRGIPYNALHVINLLTQELVEIDLERVEPADSFREYSGLVYAGDLSYIELILYSRVESRFYAAEFDPENKSVTLTDRYHYTAISNDGNYRVRDQSVYNRDNEKVGELESFSSVMMFSVSGPRLYTTDFSTIAWYDFVALNESSQFDRAVLETLPPMQSYITEALEVSPSGNTAFSVLRDTLHVTRLQ